MVSQEQILVGRNFTSWLPGRARRPWQDRIAGADRSRTSNDHRLLMSVAPALRRYTQILAALLRREEENRRQAPMESLISLLEPIFAITILSFLFYFLGRR